ncbi:uroporphyrinogen-III C-methyltransferase [Marivirga tractuosa]|uniref:uroporphyrinogen-III C-methyltransferase n=1 Tax=Marivirga tractuosa (strain ATCC 23168 / DSM 4126 / NBRC 15989 / NCIMB 1408 / VKM B-1430 / H-43) TaxID=643867 RepID=E4TTG2_MARTH|nr:uroporphyrinogen-III C-methyltransferase [Marivirga tractuosa]ADR22965.1 uroporphyrinogen-III C-methyltransferase [Marivirga tractuosa DSM 4126]BDD16361.1 uroporphyrinogen-III C-methyltransferase [Marivirga tractuosa]
MEKKLSLVGAGPGDPDLISVKGIKTLAQADVVLNDALVHPELLNYAPSKALKIYVGKRAGKHSYKQEEINELIIEHVFSHGHVVRLKGGDPFIFARGKEEIDYAESFGINTQVVPGISSINLAGMYSLPLTTRGVNESFWVVTATTKSGELSQDVAKVAETTATAVFLMGLRKAPAISTAYALQDKADLPAAIVSNGSLANAKVYRTTVGHLAQTISEQKVASPGIILVGESVVQQNDFTTIKSLQQHVTQI